ncbi:hypothetical protein [Streptomyces sp. CBMA29]|nr:hypothetical protein [Streptomyces sp. CBMA29]
MTVPADAESHAFACAHPFARIFPRPAGTADADAIIALSPAAPTA